MNGEVKHLGDVSEKAADCLAAVEAAELVRVPDRVLGEKRDPALLVGVIDMQAVTGLEFLDRLDSSSCAIRFSRSVALIFRLLFKERQSKDCSCAF
jgi:hypothetical protein